MRHSIAASTFRPSNHTAALQAGFQSDFGFSSGYGPFITGQLGVIIHDGLLIPDSSATQPFTDPTIDSIISVSITVGSNPTVTASLPSASVEFLNTSINAANGGGNVVILTGSIFDDAYNSTSNVDDIISIEIVYSINGIVQNNPIKLFHRGGVPLAPIFGYNVGCGEYRTLLTNAVTPANLSMGFRVMNTQAYSTSRGGQLGIKIAHDSPSSFNDPTIGLNISQGNTFFNGPVLEGDQLELITDPNVSQFSGQHPNIVNMQSGEELGFFCIAQDDFLPAFSAPSSGNFPGNSTPNALTFLNYTYFQVSEICEVNANIDVVQGCTDPQACNYDPEANLDNGLCQYSEFDIYLNSNVTQGTGYSPNGTQLDNDFWSPIAGGSAFIFDPSAAGTDHTITVSWGDATQQQLGFAGGSYNPFSGGNIDRVEMWVDDGLGAGPQLHDFVENVAATITTTDPVTGDVTGGFAEVTFQVPVTFQASPAAPAPPLVTEIYFLAYPNGEYGTEDACSAVSTSLTTQTPEYIEAGCTDSDALNYNAAANFDDGTCVFCNSASDLFQTINIDNQFAPASNSTATDGSTGITLSVPGQAFPQNIGALGILHIYLESEVSIADIDNYFAGTGSITSSPINDFTFNAEYLQQFQQQFVVSGLTANTQYTYYVTIPSISNGNDTDCYASGYFTQSYYACIEDDVDSVLLPFVTNAVAGTSIAISDPASPLALCTFDNALIGSQSLALTLQTASNCVANVRITASGAVPDYTTIELADPLGNVLNISNQTLPGMITPSGNVDVTSNITTSGTFTAVMTTVLPGQSPVVFPTQTLVVTDAMLDFCGCTDPQADNYNPQATEDDGSCYITGCTDPSATNYNPNATNNQPDGGTQYCIYCVYGCMDPSASNFDITASCPAPCEYIIPTFGCTDPQATNYDPAADSGDPVEYCTYPGCTDSNASNYNDEQYTLPDGTQIAPNFNDGSCIYENNDTIPGCTDPSADNYSSDATVDDGTCLYEGVEGVDTDVNSGPVLVVPDYEVFLNHLDSCVSKAFNRYYTKLITGQKCDEDVIVQLGMVNTLLKNKKINCLFDGSKNSIVKLNNLIKFVLTYCDDCEYDLAPDQNTLVGAEEFEVNTLGGLQDSNNNNIIDAQGTDIVEGASNNNNITL